MSSNMLPTLLLFILASAWGQDGVAPAGPAYGVAELGSPNELDELQDSVDDYIVGGRYARVGQFPYQVSLQISSNKFPFCGGSIVTPLWILTAAHCLSNVKNKQIEILAGSIDTTSSQVRRKVVKRINVGKYKPKITDDIALLKLQSSLPTNNPTIKTVAFPTRDTPTGTEGLVSGWGYNVTGRNPQRYLKYLLTKTVSNDQCKRSFPKDPITKDNICALTKAGEGFCQGDSGGPLVDLRSYNSRKTFQIGVVSANFPCAKGQPDIYTRVLPFVKAIKNIIKRN